MDVEGKTLPLSSLSLSLDDEVQYRCAGYIQAEIERYAETLNREGMDEEGENDNDTDETSEEEQPDNTTTGRKKRTGKAHNSPKKGRVLRH
jgi:cohesin complex subunit SA-1/2